MTTTLTPPSTTNAIMPEEKALPADLLERAIKLASETTIDPRRPDTVFEIGSQDQEKAAGVSDEMLKHVQTKDAGESGALLLELSSHCKQIDPHKLGPNWHSKLAGMKFVGKAFGQIDALLGGYSGVLTQLDLIAQKLTKSRDEILADVTMLNGLYDANLTAYKNLKVWVEVINIKKKEVEQDIAAAEAKGDANDITTSIADLHSTLDRLDRHQHDLELTAMIRLQGAPSIRIIQAGDSRLAEKMRSSVLNTLPLWKDSLALAIAQARQREGIKLEQGVDDTTNALLRANAERLHQNSVDIAKSENRGIVDLDTLAFTQKELIATIDETQQIAEEGKKQREEARKQLGAMQIELKQKLNR